MPNLFTIGYTKKSAEKFFRIISAKIHYKIILCFYKFYKILVNLKVKKLLKEV